MGILGRPFWTRPSSGTLRRHSTFRPDRLRLRPSDAVGRQQLATSASDVAVRIPLQRPSPPLRPSGGTGEPLDDPVGRRPVPAPAWAYARLRPPPMVIVLRRLEVGANWQGREALPHGHSVADCPLLRPSRRLPHPGRPDSIGGPTRVDPLYSFKSCRYSFPLNGKTCR